MIAWLKHNWALIILIAIALLWVKNSFLGTSSVQPSRSSDFSSLNGQTGIMSASNMSAPKMAGIYNPAPPSDSTNRLVIQDTSLSLQVSDVSNTLKKIEDTTKSLGGFLVNSNLSKPESAASGNITIRVPEDKRTEAMAAYKNYAVKVVSESVFGTDVTDQYVDLESKLAVLNTTKQKFEEILAKATTVNDLITVNQQLINLQSQIDAVKGQQKYYEQSAKLTKIIIYLSTDDLALPYAPTNEWRPAVVFKQAVRSLVSTTRDLGSLAIWLVVYSPIIIPVVGIIWFVRRRRSVLVK